MSLSQDFMIVNRSAPSSIYGIRSMVMFKQHEWNQVHGHVHVQGSNSKDSRALEKIDGLCKLRANEKMMKENFMISQYSVYRTEILFNKE